MRATVRPAVAAALAGAALVLAALPAACAGGAPPAERWLPAPTTAPWQWQLVKKTDTSVPAGVYEVDGFTVPAKTVARLHAQGRKVICYIDVGSWEVFRPDADDFPKS